MDLVIPVAYDAFGRQDRQYLPYATATGLGGAFKASAVAQQGHTMQALFPFQLDRRSIPTRTARQFLSHLR